MEIFHSSFPNVTVIACLDITGRVSKLSLQRQRVAHMPWMCEQHQDSRNDEETYLPLALHSKSAKSSQAMNLTQYAAKGISIHALHLHALFYLDTMKSLVSH